MRDLPQLSSGAAATRRVLACLLVLFAAVAPGRSQEAQQPPRETVQPVSIRAMAGESREPASPSDLDVRDGAIHLSRDQALKIALAQNLGLVVERYNRSQSAMRVYQQLGIYDLLARASLSTSSQEQQATSQEQPDSQKLHSFSFGLTQVLPTGGDISIDSGSSRTETSGGFTLANRFYSTGTTFTLNQPLLRSFGRLATENALLIARTNSQISRQQFEAQTIDVLRQVDTAYWNLVEAREQVGVAEESLKLARELHERNRIQVEVGTLAPLELVQSEAQIATREEGLIGAQAAVADAADELRRLLNFPPGELWDLPIMATTDPQTEHITIDLEQAISSAYAERSELRSQSLAIENAKIVQAFTRNQQLPQLDLRVTYGANGDALELSDAFQQVRQVDFPSWTASLNLTYAIQNRAARAATAIAGLDVERTEVELEQLRTLIRTEVRQAARGVETAAKQIEAARASRILQERNLDAERKRYENGMSTSFQITRIQDDLTLARSNEVSTIVNYRRRLTEYYRAIGLLLDQEGVEIIDEEPEVHRFSFSRGEISGYGKQ